MNNINKVNSFNLNILFSKSHCVRRFLLTNKMRFFVHDEWAKDMRKLFIHFIEV